MFEEPRDKVLHTIENGWIFPSYELEVFGIDHFDQTVEESSSDTDDQLNDHNDEDVSVESSLKI